MGGHRLNEAVSELVALVGGSTGSTATKQLTVSNRKTQLSHSDHVYHSIAEGTTNKTATKATARTVTAKAIPLNDDSSDDLNEFNN